MLELDVIRQVNEVASVYSWQQMCATGDIVDRNEGGIKSVFVQPQHNPGTGAPFPFNLLEENITSF